MRKYKFRGKRINDGTWIFGSLLIENPPLQCFAGERDEDKYLIGKSGFADWNMPRPFDVDYVYKESVGEFTGFHDTEKKVEIYEGDFVDVVVQNSEIFISSGLITFNQERGAWVIKSNMDNVLYMLADYLYDGAEQSGFIVNVVGRQFDIDYPM